MTTVTTISKTVAGHFGRLWSRGWETLTPHSRRILSIEGQHATTFLQGLITSDITQLPTSIPFEEKETEKVEKESDTSKQNMYIY